MQSSENYQYHSDTELITPGDRAGFSGPLNKKGGRKSARFADEYVEITLDVGEDSVAVHSLTAAGGGRVEDQELRLLAKNLENKSSLGSSVLRNASSKVRHEIKRLTSLTRRQQAVRFDRTKSVAAQALKGLKFISKGDQRAAWDEVAKKYDEITATTDWLLPRARFGECIGNS